MLKSTSVNTAGPKSPIWSYCFITHKPSLLAPDQAGCPGNPPPPHQGAVEQVARAESRAHAPRPRAVASMPFTLRNSCFLYSASVSHRANRFELSKHSALPGSHGKHILYAPLTSPNPSPAANGPFPLPHPHLEHSIQATVSCGPKWPLHGTPVAT